MYHFVVVHFAFTTSSIILELWCNVLFLAMTPQRCLFLKCTLLWMCVGLTHCFKYSQDDRHSIHLDVYCFELLGAGTTWAGIHTRKRPVWTSSSGGNFSMTWLTHTRALNGSTLNKWWAWDTPIHIFQVKTLKWDLFSVFEQPPFGNSVFLSLPRHNAFTMFTSLWGFCTLSHVKTEFRFVLTCHPLWLISAQVPNQTAVF